MNNKGQRLVWLDVMKSLAAFMVCFYHLTENNKVVDFGHFANGDYYISLEKFLYGILASCVPLFFIASGTTIRLKKKTVKANIIRALQLVLINCVCGGICNILISSTQTGEFSFALDSFLHAPFYFWYLPTLAFVYLFDIVWQRIKESRWSLIILCFLLLVPFTINLVGDILVFFNPGFASYSILHSGFFRLYALVFVFVPAIWSRELSKVSAFVMIILGMTLVGFEVISFSCATQEIYNGVNASFPTWGALLTALGIYSMVQRIPNTYDLPIFRWISSNCLGIYILHYPMIVMLIKYCSILHYGWSVQFVSAIAIIFFTAAISWILKKCGLRY